MPQYIEATTDEELECFEEAIGRAYAQREGLEYPMMPVTWGPGLQPEDRSVVAQRYYCVGQLKDGDDSGGVIELDNWLANAESMTFTLEDGRAFKLETKKQRKPTLLLSPLARRALQPKITEAQHASMRIRELKPGRRPLVDKMVIKSRDKVKHGP